MDVLEISVTIGSRNLEGQGLLLALGDDTYKRKAYTLQRPMNTLFYVQTLQDCFWVAAYYGLQFQCFDSKAQGLNSWRQVRNLARQFCQQLEMPSKSLLPNMKSFFQKANINIEQFEPGSLEAIQAISSSFDVQVSVFCDSKLHHR